LTGEGVNGIKLADLDDDGDLDYVMTEYGDQGQVAWTENNLVDTGSMGWGNGHIITHAGLPRGLQISDLDQDGNLDLVVAAHDDDAVYWLENDGTPDDVWTKHLVTDALDGPSFVNTGDIDGDGDPDVVASAQNDDAVYWYENGSSWAAHEILSSVGDPDMVELADLDFDGDLDLLVTLEVDDEVLWMENLGSSLWQRRNISTTMDGACGAVVADIDGDGDLDIAATGYLADKLSWWKNNNTHRRFAEAEAITIRDGLSNPRSVAVGDFNGDGLNDVVLGGWDDAWVKAYFRITDSTWLENTVDTGTSRFRDLSAGDFNGDGDLEIIGASMDSDEIVLWESDGAALPSWSAHTVISPFDGAHAVEPADFDCDGDLDLVVAAFDGDEATIVINHLDEGSGWTKRTFSSLDGAYDVAVGDLNGDGKQDFVVSGYYADVIRYELNGDPWTRGEITGLDGPRGVALGDIDGDGDLDIVGLIRNDDEIKWFENNGSGGGWTAHNVGSGYLDDGSEVQAIDLDHDGDVDVVATGYGGGDLRFWRNDGSGASWHLHSITSSLDAAWQVLAADLDGNNDMDLLVTAAGTSDSLSWYKNVGAQFVTVAYDYSPIRIEDGASDSIINFLISNNGRSGDHDLEISKIALSFEDENGTALSSAQINAIIDRLEIYLDTNDDALWEVNEDTLLMTDLYLSLDNGVLTETFSHGIAGNLVAAAVSEGFFVVLRAASDASSQDLWKIRVNWFGSEVECQDRSAETSLQGEPAEDLTTRLMTIGNRLFEDGFESGDTGAWDIASH